MNRSTRVLYPVLLICLAVTAVLGILLGSTPVSLKDLAQVLAARVTGAPVPAGLRSTDTIIFLLRIPRTLMMVLAGAALASSGAAYQGLFRNPLSDPYLIGVSSGAGLGAIIAMSIPWQYSRMAAFAVPLFAFIFALLTVFIVFNLGRMGGYLNITGLLLAGVAVNAFTSALSSVWILLSNLEIKRSFSWMLGGSGIVGWERILVTAPLIIAGIIGQIRYAYPLNILQFGEEQALQLGISVNRVRIRLILWATLTTSAAIACTGVIGFVGLIVPHLLRILMGSDYRKLVPLAAIGGAVMLTLSDILSRILMAPREIPVGVITAVTGAPFFLWILNRSNQAKV
ncbi:MAG: iron ABC transporter permease [Anaerolineaceae bacterium]|nr:iron ABC transporter permease [Anaerolineaceae bacterium]